MAGRRRILIIRQHQRDERSDLAALLHDLHPVDWNKPTPCPGWTVADVAAHLAAWDRLLAGPTITDRATGSARLLLLAATSRLSVHHINERIRRRSSTDPQNILDSFETSDVHRWKWRFDRISPGAQLAEYVIHHEDIRQAVGRPREIPPARLQIALAGVRRLPGVRARSRPSQPVLSGTALLLHLAGREPPTSSGPENDHN